MSRASSSMERSEPGARQRKRRQAPAAAEAGVVVGSRDGARSGSRSTGATSSSSCWTPMDGRGQCPPAYKPPYMDVQTVKTNLTIDQAAALEGQSHCLLLVEPVLLPDLGHTGVTREALPGDRPLFYPNGCKNRGLGAMVRNSLYHSASAPRLSADNGSSSTAPFDHRKPQQHPPPISSDWRAFDHRKQQQQQQQQPPNTPSDWAGRRETLSLSSRGGGSCRPTENRSEMSTSSAYPAGQGGSSSLEFSPDVLENPREAGVEGGRRRPGTAKTLSRGAADKRVMAKVGRAGQKGGRAAAPKGFLAARAAGVTRARHQEQQRQHQHQHQQQQQQQPQQPHRQQQQYQPQHQQQQQRHEQQQPQHQQQHQHHQQQYQHHHHHQQQQQQQHQHEQYHQPQGHHHHQQQQPSQSSSSINNLPPADPRHSAGTNSTITAPSSDWLGSDFGTDPRGSDTAGRDSEWVVERRAADAEARELLGALRRNSSRLWFLVGGGV